MKPMYVCDMEPDIVPRKFFVEDDAYPIDLYCACMVCPKSLITMCDWSRWRYRCESGKTHQMPNKVFNLDRRDNTKISYRTTPEAFILYDASVILAGKELNYKVTLDFTTDYLV